MIIDVVNSFLSGITGILIGIFSSMIFGAYTESQRERRHEIRCARLEEQIECLKQKEGEKHAKKSVSRD